MVGHSPSTLESLVYLLHILPDSEEAYYILFLHESIAYPR